MIHSFKCKNFYSFKDEASVDFTVDNNAPKNNSYALSMSGTRVSLVEAVIGPNASGKTNLLKALPILRWLIVDSWNLNPIAGLPVKSFVAQDKKNTPTELSVVFDIDSDTYEYEIKLTEVQIFYECLTKRSKSAKRVTQKTLLLREFDNTTGDYKTDFKGFGAPAGFSKLLRNNATAISTALRLNHPLSVKIARYWQNVDSNVSELGHIGDQVFGLQTSTGAAMQLYNSNPELRAKAESMLARFDLGFNSFEIEHLGSTNQVTFKVAHNFGDKKISLPLDYESSGTKQLFILLKTLLMALSSGGAAVIDEFDSRLHPDMVSELVGLFTDPATNPLSAQLLITTHSHQILSQLDKYQIILTEKSKSGHTESWRLDEVKGVRPDDNYYVKYMAGAYNAVPNFK
jgi:hypothetical protein